MQEEKESGSTVLPTKPGEGKIGGAPKRGEEEEAGAAEIVVTRRRFLSWLTVGWATFTGAMVALSSGILRYFFPNVLFEPPSQFKAGYPQQYPLNTVSTEFVDKYQAWIVRTEEGLFVLRAVCTHLGCTPRWLANENKFKCPCHGSGFYMSGVNFEGPAPRPLERFGVELAEDGQILIDKNRRYAYEKGEWSDLRSIIKS